MAQEVIYKKLIDDGILYALKFSMKGGGKRELYNSGTKKILDPSKYSEFATNILYLGKEIDEKEYEYIKKNGKSPKQKESISPLLNKLGIGEIDSEKGIDKWLEDRKN